MVTLLQSFQTCQTAPNITAAHAHASIDTAMMYKTIEKLIDKKVTKKLIISINDQQNNCPTVFKTIVIATFVATVATTHTTKYNLFHTTLETYNFIILK